MKHELPVNVTICQCILERKNMEQALLSFGEMGVNKIIPVNSHQILQYPIDDVVKQAWQRWASLMKHNSLREASPVVEEPIDFLGAIKLFSEYDMVIFCYENQLNPYNTKKVLESCKQAKNILIFIGPERGFTPEEVCVAEGAGAHIVSLGKRIIRASQAGAILMGMLVYELELSP